MSKKPKIIEVQSFNKSTLKEKLAEPRKVIKTFYFDKSETWYLDDSQVDDYHKLYDGGDYARGMLVPEKELIESRIILSMREAMPSKFTFLDLGPGTADKSKILIDYIIKAGREVNYVAVDVSKKMLSSALENIAELGIDVQGYRADFATDALREIRENMNPLSKNLLAFIYLGPTFMNYEPDFILNHLHKSMRKEDVIYLSAQRKYDVDDIVKQYSGQGYREMVRPMLRAMKIKDDKINFKTEIKARFNRGAIECYLTVKNNLDIRTKAELKARGIYSGDEIVFITSRKYDVGDFKTKVCDYFKLDGYGGDFFANDKFITYVGRKRELFS